MLEIVSIPTFDGLVFTGREEEVSVCKETNGHDAIVMSENGLVAISKVQSPDSDILIDGAADKKSTVLCGEEGGEGSKFRGHPHVE